MLLLFSSAIAITKSLAMRKPIERSKIKSNKKKETKRSEEKCRFLYEAPSAVASYRCGQHFAADLWQIR